MFIKWLEALSYSETVAGLHSQMASKQLKNSVIIAVKGLKHANGLRWAFYLICCAQDMVVL